MCMNLRLSCALAVLLLCPFMTLAQKNSGYDAGYHPVVHPAPCRPEAGHSFPGLLPVMPVIQASMPVSPTVSDR